MPKFLNTLNMSNNEIQNFVVHNTSSGIAVAGAMILDGTLLKYHNGTDYITLGDNDVATSTAAGVVELFSDTAQTVAANTVSTTSSRTYGVQLNGDDQMVVNVPWTDANDDTQNTTTLSFVDSTNDILIRNTTGGAGSGTDDIKIVAGTNITLTHTNADNFTITSTDTQLDNAGVIAKVLTGLSTTTGGAVAATDSILAGFGKLEKRVALNDAKVTNSTIAARVAGTGITLSTNTFNVNVGATGTAQAPESITTTASRLYQVETDDQDNLVVNIPWQDTTIANTDVDVSIPNLKTKLAGGFASNAVTIGDANDIVTIGNKLVVTGDLQVDGTTTTLNTTNLDVEDLNITIAKGAADAAAANGAGLTVDGAAATLLYRNANDNFIFNKRLDASSFHGPLTGNVTGNADTVTTNANLTGHITSTGNAAVLGSFTVAQLSTALSDATISGSNSGDGTYGIADTNYVKINGTPVNGEFAQFTANGLKSRTDAQVVSDIGAVAANAAITAATNTKITFDAKGLVTGSAALASGDIPNNAADTTGSAGSLSSTPTWNQNTTGTAAGITAGAVGAVKVFELTHGVDGVTGTTNDTTPSLTWTITHSMGASRFYKVEVIQDSANYDTVYVDVTRPTTAAIKIDFGAAVANGAYRAMVTRMA